MSATRLGPYVLHETIGRGGMGVVFRGVHHVTEAEVALKTVTAADPARLGGIVREIAALSRLRHPQIVRILDHGAEGGTPWYAMELMQGPTLRAFLGAETRGLVPAAQTWVEQDATPAAPVQRVERMAPVPLAQALSVVHALCSPLDFLHGEGLVHRDVKLDNVRVRAGVPVLLDFGLAGQATGREALSGSSLSLGTPGSSSPEQLRGALADPRTDIYALGCMLYELITGASPFGGTPAKVLLGHLHEEPRPPSEHLAGVSPQLDDLCVRMLAKEPRERPGTAGEVAQALVDLGAQPIAVSDRPPARSFLYRPGLAGRTELLTSLRESTSAMRRGEGGVRALVGPSGAGKTRVLLELARRARRERVAVLSSPIPPPDSGGLPPLNALLRGVAHLLNRIGPVPAHRIIGSRRGVLSAVEPALARAVGTATVSVLTPEKSRRRLIQYVAATLVALAAEQPVLWLVDDLQWADPVILDILEALRLSPGGVLVVATWRAEEEHEGLETLASRLAVAEVGLLTDHDVRTVVLDTLAGRPPPGLADAVVDRAAGSPFLATELLRTLLEAGQLQRSGAGWSLEDDSALSSLPAALTDVLRRRLDGLDDDARAVAERAAVIARHVHLDLMVDLGRARLLASVQELVRRQVLVADRLGQVSFAHDRLRETVLASMSEERGAQVRRAAADVLEATEERDAWLEVLATLWLAVGEPQRGRGCLLEAAALAEGRGEVAEAGRLYTEGLGLPGPQDAVLRVRVARDFLEPLGRSEDALGLLDPLGRPPEPRLQAEVLVARAMACNSLGMLVDAEGHARAALLAARASADVELECTCMTTLGTVLSRRHQLEDAEHLLQQAAARSTQARTRVRAMTMLAQCMDDTRLAEADRWLEAASALLAPGDQQTAADVGRARGRVAIRRNHFEEAEAYLAPWPGWLEEQGLLTQAGRMLSMVGLCAFHRGRFEDAVAEISRALSIQERIGQQHSAGYSAYYLARVYRIGLGDLDKAETAARRSILEAEATGMVVDMGDGLCELAHIAIARGEDCAPQVRRVKEIRAGSVRNPDSDKSLERVLRARDIARSGQPGLVHGEPIASLSPGIRAALEARGTIA